MVETSQNVLIRALSKSYLEGDHNHVVLNNINAEFETGLMHAVTGRSGSGKSTLLNLIAGIDLPDSGTVSIAGHNVSGLNERQRTLLRRQKIGIVFQFFNLIESLTVAENVMLPLELNGEPDRTLRTNEALDRVELGKLSQRFPAGLSGGEQQRVAIARAIVHKPSLILADEPTGNLDDDSAQQVISTLDESRGESTVIVVTHSMELAERCDRQWELRSGQIDMRQS